MSETARRLLEIGGARAARRELSGPGGRLSYLEAGRGPPLLLVHGADGGGANWFGVLARLARRHRVLAPDLPGFGLSPPTEIGGAVSRAVVPALLALLDAAGVARADVCGTSLGGLVALRLAQLQPERVRRLALIDAAGLGRELAASVRLATLPLLGRLLAQRPDPRSVRWQLRHLSTSSRLPRERERALLAYLLACARNADHNWFAQALRRFASPVGQREVLSDAELAGLSPPTLVIWGARDRLLPVVHGRRAAARIPQSALLVLARCGHSPNWERPATVSGALDAFLAA